MASDWIKMRTDIYRDPKVSMMADMLMCEDSELSAYINAMTRVESNVTRNVTRNAVVGALVTVWGVARHRGKQVGADIVIKCASIEVIDDIADLPGMGKAMQLVGWVEEDGIDLVFPRFFEEYNVSPSEKNAERQRRFRENRNGSNVTRNAGSNVTRNAGSNAEVTTEKRESRDKEVVGKPTEPEKPKRKPKPVFAVPTVEEVSAYCQERGNSIDPQRFIDHYTSNGWMVGKTKMKDWRAAVRTWEKNDAHRNGKPPPPKQLTKAEIDALAMKMNEDARREAHNPELEDETR